MKQQYLGTFLAMAPFACLWSLSLSGKYCVSRMSPGVHMLGKEMVLQGVESSALIISGQMCLRLPIKDWIVKEAH